MAPSPSMSTTRDIANARLNNQRLAGTPLATPADVVGWLGAVQAQDYPGATWALAQRTAGATRASIDRAYDDGAILRTHVMRPTWHFVAPADIRWLLALTAPRVHVANGHPYRRLDLHDADFTRGHAVLADALRGGRHLTRNELGARFADAGIDAGGQRLAYLLMHAELEALVCSGPLRGKQFTYALLEERVPPHEPRSRDEALAELTRRYLRSHGPATAHDLAWWSGLTVADARAGIEAVAAGFASETVAGKTFWFDPTASLTDVGRPIVHLLPNYDEHLVAYKDHAPSFDPALHATLTPGDDTLFAHIVTVDGLVVGGWRRAIGKRETVVTPKLLRPLSDAEQAALHRAAEAYSRFLGVAVVVQDSATAVGE